MQDQFLSICYLLQGFQNSNKSCLSRFFVVTVWTPDGITIVQLEQFNVHNCITSHAKAEQAIIQSYFEMMFHFSPMLFTSHQFDISIVDHHHHNHHHHHWSPQKVPTHCQLQHSLSENKNKNLLKAFELCPIIKKVRCNTKGLCQIWLFYLQNVNVLLTAATAAAGQCTEFKEIGSLLSEIKAP